MSFNFHDYRQALELCVSKTRANIRRLADDPKTGALAVDGNYFAWPEGFFEIGNWTSSFFTGMALLSYEQTKDPYFLQQCRRLSGFYRDKVTSHGMDTMHDLGFLYSLFSVAQYKITGSKEDRTVGLLAADLLAGRYVPEGRYLRAWGRVDEAGTDFAGLAIIDCLMNLPLLFWASEETGDPKYREIAVAHADTTLALFVRPDNSVCHAFRFDTRTGRPLREDNYCGHAVGSHWARGTAWAVYGFAIAHRYTRDAKYLNASLRLANAFIRNLDSEVIPLWDFKLANPKEGVRDSSAAAIAACGFIELLAFVPGEKGLEHCAQALLAKLCSTDYLDGNSSCPGVIRKSQVGDGAGLGKSAYTSWGDYFFMEAMLKSSPGFRSYW